jgi:hypothetical protein
MGARLGSERSIREEGEGRGPFLPLCGRLMRSGLSSGCEESSVSTGRKRRRFGRDVGERTVGGGLGLPSESSTLVLVRFCICSRRKARSRRSFWTCLLSRVVRTLYASFSSSISLVRSFNCIHFRRYASSTVGGRDGGFAVRQRQPAVTSFGDLLRQADNVERLWSYAIDVENIQRKAVTTHHSKEPLRQSSRSPRGIRAAR